MKCKYCEAEIYFNSVTKKWVTLHKDKWKSYDPKNRWKCGSDPAFPVKSHSPKDEITQESQT
jgi:hypothetical protein